MSSTKQEENKAAPPQLVSKGDLVYQMLEDLFGQRWRDVWVASVPGDPNAPEHQQFFMGGRAGKERLYEGDNLYFSGSCVTGRHRRKKNFDGTCILWFDDVGTKSDAHALLTAFGKPRWLVTTSPGNQQWFYKLDRWISGDQPFILERVLHAAAAQGMTDPGTLDVVRAMRLSGGINGKPKYGTPSPEVFGTKTSTEELNLEDACRALGLDWKDVQDPDWDDGITRSSVSRDTGRADLSNPDQYLSALFELDRVLDTNPKQGVVDIVCPFADEHTQRESSGTAYFGNGAFKCHHGACQGRKNNDYQAKIVDLLDEELAPRGETGLGFLARQAFPAGDLTLEDLNKATAVPAGFREAEPDADAHAIDEVRRRYAIVRGEKSIIDTVGTDTAPIRRESREEFTLYHNAKRTIGRGRTAKGLGTYCLTEGGVMPLFESIDMIDPPGAKQPGVLNIWRGLKVSPRAGAWPRIGRLLKEGIASSDATHEQFLLDWIAWGLQNPLRRIGTALCLVGEQGTGKSTVGEMLRRLYGMEYSLYASADNDIVGSFNDRLENRLLFVGDEAVFGGDPKIRGKLKALISEGMIRAEAKFQSAREITNRLKFVFTSNEAAALPIEPGDRRSTVFRVSDKFKGDLAFWTDFHGHLNDELPAFLHDMLKRDLSTFDHRKPLATSAKADMAGATASPFARILLNCIRDESLPPGADLTADRTGRVPDWDAGDIEVCRADFYSEMDARMRRERVHHPPGRTQMGQELKRLISGLSDTKRNINKKLERMYVFPNQGDCFEQIRRALGAGQNDAPP
jgi:hypothetical protein